MSAVTPRRLWTRAVSSTAFAAFTILSGCSALLDIPAPTSGGPCASNDDCPSSELCVASTCVVTCQSSADCASGTACTLASGGSACAPVDAGTLAPPASTGSETDAEPDTGSDAGVPDVDSAIPDSSPGDSAMADASDRANVGCSSAPRSCDGGACAPTLLLFGGNSGAGFLNDTWSWDGTAWTQAAPPASPPKRWSPAMGVVCNRVVVFGGSGMNNHGDLNDQWEWDGTTWTEDTPANPPPARLGPVAATLNGQLLVFGGETDDESLPSTDLDDTWTWSGTAWSQLAPNDALRRDNAAVATSGGDVVVFGGEDDNGDPIGDTWLWNGTTWTSSVDPPQSPPARSFAMAATLGDGVVVFGGFDGTNALGDTWTWDGSTWTQAWPVHSPNPRFLASMATLGDDVVLFGGKDQKQSFADTWVWDGTDWTQLPVTGPSARAGAAVTRF